MRMTGAALALVAALVATGCQETPAPVQPVAVDSVPTLAPPPPTSQAPAPRTVSLVMGGDLLWHNTVWASAAEDHRRTGVGDRYDFDPMFAWLKPVIESADLAICHEEVPFASPGERLSSYPVFRAPHQIAGWIGSMGWDACTTASNHSLDDGVEGVDETADLLEAAGVAHVGTFRSPVERRAPVILTTANGVRVGIVAATYGLNGFVLPTGHEYAVSQLGDADGLLAQARRAREAGADIVVAHVHWGTEYDHLPDATQVALARGLTASPDIDLVLGEHAHVVQPVTKVNGKWVVYGLGNMVAQSELERPSAYEGITVHFDLTEQPDGSWLVTRASYLPTQWNHYSGGDPIRIRHATGSHLASVRAAVGGVGGNPGLQED
ncbi:CapA family protein [Nocardioides sp. URHA0032]|uniref:CapA family protein n=1 Tax=Nocardioides sp. URHA0032 TaxID=1380388 RepID=UPI000686BDAF|nr:CapA family protein [Nocardioides sp. URHA0032]